MTAVPPTGADPLRRAVEVMDLLRSPGGCPWDAVQTPQSLTRYLVEECYEVLEAIETDDPVLLREELGDLLLQVLFHARLARERAPGESFGIDEVASDLVDKLVRRHPHVFENSPFESDVADVDALNVAWEAQKVREKGRTSAVDGVPIAQPALAFAAKLVSRARRAGLDPALDSVGGDVGSAGDALAREREIGVRLLSLVAEAVTADVDPESALRRVSRDYRASILAEERAAQR